MSRFQNPKYAALTAYTPGEQPRDRQYIKLNTNESPYPPAPAVVEALTQADLADLRLYSDPEGNLLREKLAALYGLTPGQVFLSNGSDDILNFAFMAYGAKGAAWPALTYSFYPVFAALHGVAATPIPLKEDFSVDVPALCAAKGMVVLANPNAPTGVALPLDQVERILTSDPDRVVVVDEAYVDFGGESAAGLVDRYDNLLVVMTYSKSRSMAGARLGFALASRGLIEDLETLKYSTNPYNVNRLTLKLGQAAVEADDYFRENARRIMATREKTAAALQALGFSMPPSQANFLFITHPAIDGLALYEQCKAQGVLIRHFSDPAIAQYNRVSIGSEEEMAQFLTVVTTILAQEGRP